MIILCFPLLLLFIKLTHQFMFSRKWLELVSGRAPDPEMIIKLISKEDPPKTKG